MPCISCDARVKVTGKLQIEAQYTDTGRCCIGSVCTITTEGGCGGSWTEGAGCTWYAAGVAAVANACVAWGACCEDEDTCIYKNEANCTGAEVYLGDWSSCTGDPCSDPVGECCRGGVCTVTTEGNCSDGNWTVTGDCSPNPCPDTPRVLSFF